MAPITWTPAAIADLDSISEYIGENSPDYAPIFVDKIVEAAQRLRDFPEIGRRVPEVAGFRELVFHNYRIIYESREDGIWIMAVMHGAMDFRKLAARRGWNLS